MKTINKAYFTIEHGYYHYFLIDNDTTKLEKIRHIYCITLTGNNCIKYNYKHKNSIDLNYLERDACLPKPTIKDYEKASNLLKNEGLVYNKKKGMVENREIPK